MEKNAFKMAQVSQLIDLIPSVPSLLCLVLKDEYHRIVSSKPFI